MFMALDKGNKQDYLHITHCLVEGCEQAHYNQFDLHFLGFALNCLTFHNDHLKEMAISEYSDFQLFHNDLVCDYLIANLLFVVPLHKGCNYYLVASCIRVSVKFSVHRHCRLE